MHHALITVVVVNKHPPVLERNILTSSIYHNQAVQLISEIILCFHWNSATLDIGY